jgi:hypothetical protein
VHIDPEEDLDESRVAKVRMPTREILLNHLQPLLADLPPPERVVLHYLGGRVEAEVFLDQAFFSDGIRAQSAVKRLAERLRGDPYFRVICLNCQVAPQ